MLNLTSEYQFVGQDPTEYDFRDFRMAKLERLRRSGGSIATANRDETLLEFRPADETAAPSSAPSPHLDAMDVSRVLTQPAMIGSTPSMPTAEESATPGMGFTDPRGFQDMVIPHSSAVHALWGLMEPEASEQVFPLDWSLLLGESELPGYQTGNPNMFWDQL
jgi:hypothetical protein